MSSGCGDVLSLEDLRLAKLHQKFEAEVITGKAGGLPTGEDIDYATNQVTGQTQKTLPAILRDAGFRPASFTFVTGGALAVGDSDRAVLWPVSSGGDGNYYVWKGAYPKVIPAASTPATTGGVSSSGWMPAGDITLRPELASSAVNKGDALITVKSELTGTVSRTQHSKNSETISVLDYGAKGDGVVDDTPAFQAAYNNAPENGEIIIPPGFNFKLNSFNGSKRVTWKNLGASLTSETNLPGVLFNGKQYIHNHSGSQETSLFITRIADYTGGSKGYVNAGIFVDSTSGPAAESYEWAVVGRVNNKSPAGVENVGGYFQGNMYSTGGTWGAVAEVCDMNFNGNINRRETVGIEIDNYFNGPDTSVNRIGAQIIAGDANLNRKGVAGEDGSATYALHITRQGGGALCQWSNGVTVSNATDTSFQANATGQRAFRIIGSYAVGYETYQASLSGPAIRIGQGQTISLDRADSCKIYSAPQSIIFSANSADKAVIDAGSVRPYSDNSISLGAPSYRFTGVFAASGTINTSDANYKTKIRDIEDTEKKVASELKPMIKAYLMKDAYEEKGDKARIHFGVIAQEVKALFDRHGLDASRYAFLCYDEWPDEYEPVMAKRTAVRKVPVSVIYVHKDPVTEDLIKEKSIEYVDEEYEETYDTGEVKLVKKAGSRYGIRYSELAMFILSAI